MNDGRMKKKLRQNSIQRQSTLFSQLFVLTSSRLFKHVNLPSLQNNGDKSLLCFSGT